MASLARARSRFTRRSLFLVEPLTGCPKMRRNAEAETHVEKQWQGDGTTLSLEEIIIGRCYNYIRVVNPSVGEKNCSQIWEAFRDAFIFKDPCKVLPKDYEPFIRLTVHDVPLNKSLFWENSQLLVGRYADNTKRMMPLDGTLMGWLAQGLAWCGHPGGTGMNYKSCPTTDECEHNPVESFWRIASEAYAKLAAGVIHVMLNGSVSDGAYPVNGFFAKFELTNLIKDNILNIQIWVMDEIEGPDNESCGSKTIKLLETTLQEDGFQYTCTDNYKPVRLLQCVDFPTHHDCLCAQ
ncbi:ADP-ribosyl cyclase/cyclic ADP-ribose hydrolase 2-like isoform X1 [Acipenser ruthenus]|uniref:ADP-ribosyl cyclase/cyclic ADP-ribose hydrolase 2-like isoform X1 n=1 Tax=Acipenser ruthenus TaxID=7906 RepID=UPI002741D2EA|nr:ADP-ribosyl cyclase/cyclic ADP-ribose hydrolase 2-like isoform X1 [Acipenser ruthenus]